MRVLGANDQLVDCLILLLSWAEQRVLSRVFLRPHAGLCLLAFPGACSGCQLSRPVVPHRESRAAGKTLGWTWDAWQVLFLQGSQPHLCVL